MQVLKKHQTDILDKLMTMNAEDGAALMRQLFNPLRGKHVGFREDVRKQFHDVVKEEETEDEEEGSGGAARSLDIPPLRAFVYS